MASKALWFGALLILLPCLSAMAKQTYLSTRYQQLPWEPQISQLTRKPPPTDVALRFLVFATSLTSVLVMVTSKQTVFRGPFPVKGQQNYKKRMRKANGTCALRSSELRHLARSVHRLRLPLHGYCFSVFLVASARPDKFDRKRQWRESVETQRKLIDGQTTERNFRRPLPLLITKTSKSEPVIPKKKFPRHVQQDAPKHVFTETTEEKNYKILYQNESAKTLAD
ncbi:hypothetical protein PS2_001443 [Malus domestica]